MDVTNVMINIIDTAAKENAAVDGDYIGNDELLYCGKCHTSKQVRGLLFGKPIIQACMCDCKKAALEEQKRQLVQKQREQHITEMRQNAFPQYSEYKLMTFENADGSNEKQMRAAKCYCEQFKDFYQKGKGLMFYGSCGTGKSYIAACIANKLIDDEISVLFTTLPKIVNRLQSTYGGKDEIYDELRRVPLLILDDFRSERSTEYMQEVVFEVINGRIESGKPLIITTNLTANDIKAEKNTTEQRIFSRLLQITIPIEVNGEDKRIEASKCDYLQDKAKLGL